MNSPEFQAWPRLSIFFPMIPAIHFGSIPAHTGHRQVLLCNMAIELRLAPPTPPNEHSLSGINFSLNTSRERASELMRSSFRNYEPSIKTSCETTTGSQTALDFFLCIPRTATQRNKKGDGILVALGLRLEIADPRLVKLVICDKNLQVIGNSRLIICLH